MSGPKHLWSGNWEDESAAQADRIAAREPQPAETAPPAPPARPAPARPAPPERPARARRRITLPNRRLRIPLLLGIAALLLVVGGAYGLNALLSSGSGTSTAAGTVVTGSSRPVMWLGMEIVTQPPGVAVVETVRPGSLGDRAGLSPGDVLLDVNNQPVRGAGDIAGAIRGLHRGDQVEMQISHGSALYVARATLAAPPSAYP
jgi:hypothetical protein